MTDPTAEEILREACMKIRLYGSPWWVGSWPTPDKLAHDALNEADRALSVG